MRKLFAIYGASGCGRGVMPLLRDQIAGDEDSEAVFIDDTVFSGPQNGQRTMNFDSFVNEEADEKQVTIAIADPQVRKRLSEACTQAGLNFHSVSAASHIRMDDCRVGEGAVFSPFTTLTSNIRIGRHFHCNINSYVEHDCVIGDFVTFAPGVQCNGNIHIGDYAYIGAGAVIRQGTSEKPLVIGKGAVIGMGAVVTRDVSEGTAVVGSPARPLNR